MAEKTSKHKELRAAAIPLIKFLNENFCPCASAIVTSKGVEIVEGVMSYKSDFVKN